MFEQEACSRGGPILDQRSAISIIAEDAKAVTALRRWSERVWSVIRSEEGDAMDETDLLLLKTIPASIKVRPVSHPFAHGSMRERRRLTRLRPSGLVSSP